MSGIIRYRVTFPDSPAHFLDFTAFGESEVRAKVEKWYPGREYRIEQVV